MTTLTNRSTKGSALTHAELDANFDKVAQTKAAAYTIAVSDNRDTIEYTGSGSESFTLPDASTVAAASDTGDFEVTIKHIGTGVLTITCTTGADTIDGSTGDITLIAYESVTLKVEQAAAGYNIIARNKLHRGCLVYKSADETISDSTYTHLSFDTEEYDTDSIHDTVTNNQRLTVPSGVTKVRMSAQVMWTSNATGQRFAAISKNDETTFPSPGVGGAQIQLDATASLGFQIQMTSAIMSVTSGDYFTLCVLQNSGGNLDIDASATGSVKTWFSMEIIE